MSTVDRPSPTPTKGECHPQTIMNHVKKLHAIIINNERFIIIRTDYGYEIDWLQPWIYHSFDLPQSHQYLSD